MSDPNLLRSIINSAEKASNIARICRSNEALLSLLVQEKVGDEANTRFEHDFKTLADVLIQETIKHDVGSLFSELRDNIKGEESPVFTNKYGESVSIAVAETEDETAQCLENILAGNLDVAKILASEVHREVTYTESELGNIPALPDSLEYSELGIWIDPIDATAEYISGDTIFTDFPGITSTGLDCVTVLIGVYNRSSGEPVMGVISQPFHNKVDENIYRSLIFWGIALPDLKASNCYMESSKRSNRLAIFSSSEHAEILQKFIDAGYELAFSAGAGHKSLKVITWEVDFYLLSKNSTFKWDTCGPQAILRSLGGNIFDFKRSVEERKPIPINYLEKPDDGGKEWKCNNGGLLAVRNLDLLEVLLEKFYEP